MPRIIFPFVKPRRTLLAGELENRFMSFHMLPQSHTVHVRILAYRTHEVSLSGVPSHVLLQFRLYTEAFRTQFAFELLRVVSSCVFCQHTSRIENAFAHVTLESV